MRRSDGEPSACRSIATWDMTVLPFATQIKNRSATIKRDYALEVEVTLCVRGVLPSPWLCTQMADTFLAVANATYLDRARLACNTKTRKRTNQPLLISMPF